MDVYPNIGLDPNKFKTAASMQLPPRSIAPLTFQLENHWANSDNHVNFFTDLAEYKGFDPLVPENWYSLGKDDVNSQKVPSPPRPISTCFLPFMAGSTQHCGVSLWINGKSTH
jgi:hypothetical protein